MIASLIAETAGISATLDLQWASAHWIYDRVYRGEVAFSQFVQNNRHEFSKGLIKDPNLTPFFKPLSEIFPQAKFVFVVRDPRDNLRSILNRLHLPGHLEKLETHQYEEFSHAWQKMLDGSWLGLDGTNYIEMLAARWNFMADVFLSNRERFFPAKYEDFNCDKIRFTNELTLKLGLKPVHSIENRINFQFQPKGNHTVSWTEFFGEQNLASIERICFQRMQAFGYMAAESKA